MEIREPKRVMVGICEQSTVIHIYGKVIIKIFYMVRKTILAYVCVTFPLLI